MNSASPTSPRRLIRLRNWYHRFERPLSSISLVGGFVFDALTLKRVDLFWENFWVVIHLLIVAVCIVWINAAENDPTNRNVSDPGRLHFWLVNALQFFFGGLLSTYLVFYFRSGTLASSWPFLIILTAAFVANEALKKHYSRLVFQISLLFLSIFCFMIYLVPVLTHSLGSQVFLESGGLSLLVLGLFLTVLKIVAKERFRGNRLFLYLSIAGIFFGVNALYFLNLIPPIPLSLKDSGIYQTLRVIAPGQYAVTQEPEGQFAFLGFSPPVVHVLPGGTLFAYSAIFSPSSWSTSIIHEWQWYDPQARAWTTEGRIPLSVNGGRDGGYRTFSEESDLTPGSWRVNVKTTDGAVIGTLKFTVVNASTTPQTDALLID